MNDLQYKYPSISTLNKTKGVNNLVMAHQSEIEEVNTIPCFFWGSLFKNKQGQWGNNIF